MELQQVFILLGRIRQLTGRLPMHPYLGCRKGNITWSLFTWIRLIMPAIMKEVPSTLIGMLLQQERMDYLTKLHQPWTFRRIHCLLSVITVKLTRVGTVGRTLLSYWNHSSWLVKAGPLGIV